ncbi:MULTISPECIES: NUDIX domain-containing protein [Vreelandella]|uniref:NUDIX domain-containing protein n=2 Tax=Vreelandella TaxID=3137766 RepID=A0A7C9K6H4_9GAMM|nr:MULTISPECIES: NUDIX domain-containing protein [Halomonas]NDL70801.1 NUDIX domain-containing protein [Halomonas alkaliphila]NYS45302.1 NUDIX domain-containing protein [Halomonas zhaodongensis]
MQHLAHLVHSTLPTPFALNGMRVLERQASRAIVTRDDRILLLYTERYDDFSFPGGGVDPGESPEVGLHRELYEETGAQDIQVTSHFGYVTEYTPTWKKQWDVMFQTSHWFTCHIGNTLGEAKLEDYEAANGMAAKWVSLEDALHHNRDVISRQPASMGISIHRETLVLERVASALAG